MSDPMQPAVSVLVPIYNVESYLEECLGSLRSQTFTDFEAICINDGSTDNSRKIIEQFLEKDSRFRMIDKANSGYGASMNMGLNAAQGKYIAILESDDFFEPNALELLHEAAERFDAQVAKANCFYYHTGPPEKNTFCAMIPLSQAGRLINPQIEQDIFLKTPSIWAGIYLRSFLVQNKICFSETPGASYQDLGFNFKVWASAMRVVFLKDAIIHYRQDNLTSSVNSAAKVYCVCDEFAEISRFLAARKDVPRWMQCMKTRVMFASYMWNYDRLASEFRLDFLRRFSKDLSLADKHGYLDLHLFESWNRVALKSILLNPEKYHKNREKAGSGQRGKALYYLRHGGPLVLAALLSNKLKAKIKDKLA